MPAEPPYVTAGCRSSARQPKPGSLIQAYALRCNSIWNTGLMTPSHLTSSWYHYLLLLIFGVAESLKLMEWE